MGFENARQRLECRRFSAAFPFSSIKIFDFTHDAHELAVLDREAPASQRTCADETAWSGRAERPFRLAILAAQRRPTN